MSLGYPAGFVYGFLCLFLVCFLNLFWLLSTGALWFPLEPRLCPCRFGGVVEKDTRFVFCCVLSLWLGLPVGLALGGGLFPPWPFGWGPPVLGFLFGGGG